MVGEFDRRRHYLLNAFQSLKGIEFNYPHGAFYLFFNIKSFLNRSIEGKKIRTSDGLCDYFLMKHHLAMVPGSGFGAKDWVRISYACSMAELEKAVDRLRRGLEQLH